MPDVERVSLLPNIPAVYAMYGGRGSNLYVAYIGVAERLRSRVEQHLVRRESSVTVGSSAVNLNSDFVTELRWWVDPAFVDRAELEAAELVAFDRFEPILRSRGRIRTDSRVLADTPDFQARMQQLFGGTPAGRLVIPTLQEALDRLAKLERRIQLLERHVDGGDS